MRCGWAPNLSGHHFVSYVTIELLCRTPETPITLTVNRNFYKRGLLAKVATSRLPELWLSGGCATLSTRTARRAHTVHMMTRSVPKPAPPHHVWNFSTFRAEGGRATGPLGLQVQPGTSTSHTCHSLLLGKSRPSRVTALGEDSPRVHLASPNLPPAPLPSADLALHPPLHEGSAMSTTGRGVP